MTTHVIVKTCTGNSGKRFQKILTGKSRIGAEFTRMGDAVNVMTWQTREGALRFMDERSTFKSGHEVNGDAVSVELYDTKRGALAVAS